MKNSILRDEIITKELKLMDLLVNAELVGGIYNMGFEECSILTNDIWKRNAGGIPKHCFLLASVMESGKAPISEDDEEIILLRVIGPAQLPTEKELINVRSDAMREIITEKGRESAKEPSEIIDILTRNEIQFSGIKAKILGTYYEEFVNDSRILTLGSDVDNFYSASRYKVYKPYGTSLSTIVSYPKITKQEELKRQETGVIPKRIRIGTVRYSSTLRRSKKIEEKKSTNVSVNVNIEDFISMKTAIFGMTRLGKSNTMKIIATAVFQYAIERGVKIGQLLFDPTGEYTYINQQDNTALSQLGNDYVSRFKYGKTEKETDFRPLSLNFFENSNIEGIWTMIKNHVSKKDAEYFKSFVSADVVGPSEESKNYSEAYRAVRRRAALYATLKKAGFKLPKKFQVVVKISNNVIEKINEMLGESDLEFKTWGKANLTLNEKNIEEFFSIIAKINKENPNLLKSSSGKPWIDTDLSSILNVYQAPRGRIGYNVLKTLRVFHTPYTKEDYVKEIINELKDGKIVIIDLSKGDENLLQFLSERIINGILEDASENFTQNKDLDKIQIFIEEAHRLFSRTRFEKPSEADPYVRLAKEAAKYKIGLIYATQEVTSVDSQVLANTSNWIVTHLNNHKEVRELSKYYDFEDYYDQIIRSEDVGFARIKTRSGRYIIPTQIDLFSPERIEDVRKSIEKVKNNNSD